MLSCPVITAPDELPSAPTIAPRAAAAAAAAIATITTHSTTHSEQQPQPPPTGTSPLPSLDKSLRKTRQYSQHHPSSRISKSCTRAPQQQQQHHDGLAHVRPQPCETSKSDLHVSTSRPCSDGPNLDTLLSRSSAACSSDTVIDQAPTSHQASIADTGVAAGATAASSTADITPTATTSASVTKDNVNLAADNSNTTHYKEEIIIPECLSPQPFDNDLEVDDAMDPPLLADHDDNDDDDEGFCNDESLGPPRYKPGGPRPLPPLLVNHRGNRNFPFFRSRDVASRCAVVVRSVPRMRRRTKEARRAEEQQQHHQQELQATGAQ